MSWHCEDPAVIAKDPRRPPLAEISAIEQALELTDLYHLRSKICHVSTQRGMELIEAAKKSLATLTCEVTPHHLYFTQEDSELDPWLHMNPPLRSEEDRDYLFYACQMGLVDFLASDHAPHTPNEKHKGAAGVPHLDTYGPFVGWLLDKGMPPRLLAQMTSFNPGAYLGIPHGLLQPGYRAELTVLSHEPLRITPDILQTKCGWSPFECLTLPWRVEAVFV